MRKVQYERWDRLMSESPTNKTYQIFLRANEAIKKQNQSVIDKGQHEHDEDIQCHCSAEET